MESLFRMFLLSPPVGSYGNFCLQWGSDNMSHWQLVKKRISVQEAPGQCWWDINRRNNRIIEAQGKVTRRKKNEILFSPYSPNQMQKIEDPTLQILYSLQMEGDLKSSEIHRQSKLWSPSCVCCLEKDFFPCIFSNKLAGFSILSITIINHLQVSAKHCPWFCFSNII